MDGGTHVTCPSRTPLGISLLPLTARSRNGRGVAADTDKPDPEELDRFSRPDRFHRRGGATAGDAVCTGRPWQTLRRDEASGDHISASRGINDRRWVHVR
jgi:hypothetical protein